MLVVVAGGPLEGVLVLDLSERVAGPYCARLFGDYGARVVKIERPGGDPCRRMGPHPAKAGALGSPPENSGMFLHLNANKEGVVIDVAREEGAAVVRAMAGRAHVVIESYRPSSAEAHMLSPGVLRAQNPSLVHTSVTPFGRTGPYRDYEMTEIVAYAMGGPMNATGVPGREPVKLGGNVVQMQSGSTAATATLGSLYRALQTGRGQHVDVSTFETQNGTVDRRRYYLLAYSYSGFTTERSGTIGFARRTPGGYFEASDGQSIFTGRLWPDHMRRMVAVIDDPIVNQLWNAKHDDFVQNDADYDAVEAAMARWAASRPARDAMHAAQQQGWPVVVVNNPVSLLHDDHLLARGFWTYATHPVAGTLPHTGAPWRIDGDGWSLRRTAPLLGQDTDNVLTELAGLGVDEIADLRDRGIVA